MPIYEFLCKDCRKEFKTLRSVKEIDSVNCPSCGTGRVSRLLSVTAHTPANGEACPVPGVGRCMGNPDVCGCRN